MNRPISRVTAGNETELQTLWSGFVGRREVDLSRAESQDSQATLRENENGT